MTNKGTKDAQGIGTMDVEQLQRKEWLSPIEVAGLLNLNVYTIYKWVNKRKIAYTKIMGSVRIARKDLDAMLAGGRVASADEERTKSVLKLSKMGVKVK